MAEEKKAPRPFLKWAGGKTRLLPELLRRVPEKFGTYYEPFLGGGALFWALRPPLAVLGDANLELVRAFQGVQKNVERVIRELDALFDTHGRENYLARRGQDWRRMPLCESAARTIYLNKTCFNGLYRVNRDGGFNVPMGKWKNLPRPDADNLRACSAALRSPLPGSRDGLGVELEAADFCELLKNCREGDFAYLDPPYVPTSETSYFTSFTPGGFGADLHRVLADLVVKLKDRGVHVLLSNSAAEESVKLYESRGLRVEQVSSRRSISCRGGGRGEVGEILVT